MWAPHAVGPKIEEAPAAASAAPGAAEPTSSTATAASSAAASSAEAGLLLTAALWGTYAPALKLILADAATAPSPAALTAARGTLQALLLFGLAGVMRGGGDQAATTTAPPSSSTAPPSRPPVRNPVGALLTTPAPSAAWAGLELGALNFGAAALHAAGLARTSATAASFIVCVTAILTPALAAATGEKQSARVWAGCAVALAGAAVLAADSAGGGGGGAVASPTALAGDAFVLAAAVFYSITTVRLSQHAPRFDAAALAAGKSAALAAAATVFVVLAAAGSSGGLLPGLTTAVGGLADPAHHQTQAALLAWTAAGPGAAAALLQTRGQATVPPARAQTLFAAVPVFSAAFAFAFLGERLGPVGLVGGALILLGGVVAREPTPGK